MYISEDNNIESLSNTGSWMASPEECTSGVSGGGSDGGGDLPPQEPTVYKVGTLDWYINTIRDPKWLRVDTLVSEEERELGGKVVLLFLISKSGGYIKLYTSSDNPDVDWGDGTTTSGTNSIQERVIDYNSLPASTELDNGLRQCIVTVTSNGEKPLKYLTVHSDSISPVEMVALASDLATFTTTGYRITQAMIVVGEHKIYNGINYLEGLEYISIKPMTPSRAYGWFRSKPWFLGGELDMKPVTVADYAFAYSNNKNVDLIDSPLQAWTASGMYQSVLHIDGIKPIDYSQCTRFYNFASSALIIRTPLIDLQSAVADTATRNIFYYCIELQTIDIINCTTDLTLKYCRKLPLTEIIKIGLTGIKDLSGLEQDPRLVEIVGTLAKTELEALEGTDTITYNGISYTHDDILNIFINKNWELKLT